MSEAESSPAHVRDLLASVDARFAAGRTVPDWPDPLADPSAAAGRREAREEEYSRVSHPERYAIIGERVDAWVAELTDRGLADVEESTPPRTLPVGHPDEGGDGWLLIPRVSLTRVRVLRPRRDGALPLVLGTAPFVEDPGESLVVATGDPFVELVLVPDCGCDACDSGSADLLRWLDESLLPVVDGSLRVHVEGGTTRVASAGTASSSTANGREARERTRALGRRAHEYAGLPWDARWPERSPHPYI